MKEYHEDLILAIGFDGTIVEHEYPYVGIFRKNALTVLRRLADEGFIIIIWTCRNKEKNDKAFQEMVDHLEVKNIKYHYINENTKEVIESFGETRKVLANIYIDDRQVGGLPDDWEDIYQLIKKDERRLKEQFSMYKEVR